ncbi:hypothetical protein I4U23_008365 [Adineta vaga]|nr:hypothetical protein I4U23_008365 [Adineta vaga]
MEIDIHLTHDRKEKDKEENKTFKSSNRKTNLFIDVCQSSSIFIFLIIIAIIPILQIFMGWRYSDACPINKLIPHYSIVAGIVSLFLVILISITQFITRVYGRKMFDDNSDKANPNRATMLVGCGICSIMCINLSLFIFLLGWSITGLVWVVEVWHRVQYLYVDKDDYCHPILYQFTFSILLITTILKLIFFCFVCKKTCVKVATTRRKDTITSEDG